MVVRSEQINPKAGQTFLGIHVKTLAQFIQYLKRLVRRLSVDVLPVSSSL